MKELRPKNVSLKFSKTIALGFALLSFFVQSISWAENWIAPLSKDVQRIQITNPNSTPTPFWVAPPINSPDSIEKYFNLSSQGTVTLDVKEYSNWNWIQIKSQINSRLQVKLILNSQTEITLNEGRSDRLALNKIAAGYSGVVHIFNISPIDQEGHLILFSSFPLQSRTLGRFQIDGFGSTSVPVKVGIGERLEIQGQFGISAIYYDFNPNPINPPQHLNSVESGIKTEFPKGSTFLVSNPKRTESFLFSTEDKNLIQSARKQIKDRSSPMPRILIAKIQKGNTNFNRNWTHKNKGLWSWSVREAIRFADLASQACDGSPQMIEDFLLPWTDADTPICLWNYKVMEELSN